MTTSNDGRRHVSEVAAAYASDEAIGLDALLAAIRDLGPQYAFERDGRAEAIAAVRDALPVVERDLFDVIVEDHACEVATLNEAIAHLTTLLRHSPRPA